MVCLLYQEEEKMIMEYISETKVKEEALA